MTGRIDGGRNRIHDLEMARKTSHRRKSMEMTAQDASIFIDRVFLNYGMDPTLWTDPSGWRHIMIGSAEGYAGIVEWQPDDPYLVVLAPIFDLPEEKEQLGDFYYMLLELNYHSTLSAHFSIHEDTIYLGVTRPIRGLDEIEVEESIRTVMALADSYDDRLKEILQLIPPSMPQLPDIKMRPQEAQLIGSLLGACDPHGQQIFRLMMESWEGMGHFVVAKTTGIGLKFTFRGEAIPLAALHPGFAERRQEVILLWEGLRQKYHLPSNLIEDFQIAVQRISDIRTTESTAHIEVTEAFDQESTKAILHAMLDFIHALEALEGETCNADKEQGLPKLELQTDDKTLVRIGDTLRACEPRIHRLYAQMIQEWGDAGGKVECLQAGRIYLKFKTREHPHGRYGKLAHDFNLAILSAPAESKQPSIKFAWNLASGQYAYLPYAANEDERYQEIVSTLPGFLQESKAIQIILSDSFREEHAHKLLQAMLDLKTAAGG